MRTLLIDTNILVLLIIGTWDRERIRSHRRTNLFSPSDFDILQEELRRHPAIATTPGVLTEASNLMGNDFHRTISKTFVKMCSPFLELHRPKQDVFQQAAFARLGFADASILGVLESEIVVLTDDVKLYLQVQDQGYQSINFNHLRKL